jgi:hypothetical protein
MKENILYVILLDKPKRTSIIIDDLEDLNISDIHFLGFSGDLKWRYDTVRLDISVPDNLWDSPAYSLKIVFSN